MKRLVIYFLFLSLIVTSCNKKRESVVIGSKNFTESIILAELIAQQIEAETGLTVVRKFNLGGTFICHQALVAGEIDIYPEYTGTALTAILKRPPESDPRAVYQIIKQDYEKEFGVTVTEPFGFNNTFAILIRGEEARNLKLTTISEAAKFTPEWQAGFGYEFMERSDGYQGLSQRYGLHFKEAPRVMDLALTYRALADRRVDLIAGNSTDGLIAVLDLFMLADDKNYFPPYEAVPLVRIATLERIPPLRSVLTKLNKTISENEMQKLNNLVDVDKRDINQVVREYRATKKL
jgi:osmoprotectant transport system substrate-binding protein